MAALSHSESRRKYSWWWDSRIRAKNSKWLQENLADIDGKIKSMIKIIEEDADSFAKRAEMYYRRRPELMSLIEEFYRAYRGLAERYDHATGALRQAHRTMAAAFPDQIPLDFDDDDDGDDENDDDDDGDDGNGDMPLMFGSIDLQKHIKDYETLKKEVLKLTQENEELKGQITSHSECNKKSESDLAKLKDTLSKLEIEKESALLQSQESAERLSKLNVEISHTQAEFSKFKDETQARIEGLRNAEERCNLLERNNQSLHLELVKLKQRAREKEEEVEKLTISLQAEQMQKMQAEMARISLEKKVLEAKERTKGFSKLQKEMERMKEENRKLHDQNHSFKEQCVVLARANEALYSELEEKFKKREGELKMEIERLKVSLQEEQVQKMEAEMDLLSLEKKVVESQEKLKSASKLQKEMERMREENRSLQVQNHSSSSKLSWLQDEISNALERCMELDRAKESLHLEFEEKLRERERELEKEIERLNISLEEEQLQKMQVEMSILSLEKKLADTHEKSKSFSKVVKEMERIKEENKSLYDQNCSYNSKISRLQDEMSSGMERCVVLERTNKSLYLELERTKQRQTEQEQVLKERSKAEFTNSSLEKQLIETQEKLCLLSMDKSRLDKEIEKIREENKKLGNQNRSANSKIIHLQDELISLKDVKRRLENENSLHLKEKKIAQEELSRIRDDKSDLEWRHFSLTEQIQSVNLNVESLQGLVKELKDGNFELKEIIKNHEGVKLLHCENLKQLERVSEKNAVLEQCLSVANAELEGIRRKKKELEDSTESLYSKIYEHQSERAEMVSQIEAMSENIEKLVVKKILLETSLSDANAELDGLRERLKELEGLYQSLTNENVAIRSENITLTSEVKSVGKTLANLEKKYSELQHNHSNLQREKDMMLAQVTELQNLLNLEKEEHAEILNLQKMESQKTREELEAGQKRITKAQSEIFTLQRSLNDVNTKLSSEIKEKSAIQREKEKLAGGIRLIQESLKLNYKYESLSNLKDENHEIVLQLILHEIRFLLNSLSDAQESKQNQLIEKSLVVTLLEHFGREVADLRLERYTLKQEYEAKNRETEELKKELEFLVSQLSELQESRRSLQTEIIELFEQNSSLSNKLNSSNNKGKELDMELHGILTEAIAQDILGVIFKSVSEQRFEEGKLIEFENERLRKEVKELRNRENNFASEHQKAIDVINSCDEEITILLGNIKNAIFNAALFKEKVLELIITCESFEVSEMVQREVLREEISQRNSYVDELKEKLNAIEMENRRLKVDLNGDFMILGSLQDEVQALEEQTLSLAKNHLLAKHTKEENTREKEDKQTESPLAHNSELQKLHSTIKSLQTVVTNTASLLEQERLDFASSLADARKKVEMLKLKEISDDDLTEVNYEQMLKDIQLDLVQSSNSSQNSNKTQSFQKKDLRSGNKSPTDELWGLTGGEINSSNERKKQQNIRSLMQQDIELECPQIEIMERDNKGKRISTDEMAEKELRVDRLVLQRQNNKYNNNDDNVKSEPHQEWKKRVSERLSSDARRLLSLQSGLQELKLNVESSSQVRENTGNVQLDSVRAQLREVEGTISQLIDTNNKLSKKAEDLPSSDGFDGENNTDLRSKSERKISDRARKVSEKVGRLELEMQKIQQMLLKLEEEHVNRSSNNNNNTNNTRMNVQKKSKVLLVEYLYGRRRDSRRQRRAPPCGCMRFKNRDD